MRLAFFLIPILLAMAAAACSSFTPDEAQLVPSESLPVENLALGNPTAVGAGESIPTQESPTGVLMATEEPREIISLSISLFLLMDDKENPDPEISTHRTEADLREILEGMNEIWRQAGIRLELDTVESVEVPEAMLRGMQAGDLRPFFSAMGRGIALPEPSTINGFYLRRVGGPNGINRFRSRTFFVIDEPSVFDRRVSSHEVGHMLGLHHVLDDPGRLLFSGSNGMALTEDEATVARYFAQGINRGIR